MTTILAFSQRKEGSQIAHLMLLILSGLRILPLLFMVFCPSPDFNLFLFLRSYDLHLCLSLFLGETLFMFKNCLSSHFLCPVVWRKRLFDFVQ